MTLSKAFIREIFVTLLFCVLGGSVMTYFTCVGCRSSVENYVYVSLISCSIWFVMWQGNSILADYTSKKIPWIQFPLRRLTVGILGTVIYSIGSLGLLLMFWNFFLQITFDYFFEIAIFTLVITFLISLFFHSRAFFNNWKQSAINAERLERETAVARYDSLKNQVNPHFLFNSLNALTNLVYEDPDKAAKFIKQLSEVYRYVLDTRNKEVVTLEEELKFLQSYLFLQQIRFGDKLDVDLRIDKIDSMVAPLALQMLVENAIKHNVISNENPLRIKLFADNGFLIVENSLRRKNVLDEDSGGLGLDNIRKRYEFLSPVKVDVKEENHTFTVKLPIIGLRL